MRSDKKKNNHQKRRMFFETLLSLVILSAIFLGALTGYYSSKIETFLDDITMAEEVDDSLTEKVTQQIYNSEPFSTLILGTDMEEGENRSRSDTIIVITVNPKDNSMKMISIPRDTLITLPNQRIEKINAAYTVGGPALASEIVEELLNIPIEFYATMDFRGLVELVDAVGGITVNSDLAFTEGNSIDKSNPIKIQKGIQILNGEDALGYARMRKKDPRGDFGRQDRQKEVIVEILDKIVSLNTLTNLPEILNAVKPYLKTNATSSQVIAIASNYTNVLTDIEQLALDGSAGTEYFPHYGLEVYVWEPYESSLEEVQNTLREHLELETGSNTKIISSEDELANSPVSDNNNDF